MSIATARSFLQRVRSDTALCQALLAHARTQPDRRWEEGVVEFAARHGVAFTEEDVRGVWMSRDRTGGELRDEQLATVTGGVSGAGGAYVTWVEAVLGG